MCQSRAEGGRRCMSHLTKTAHNLLAGVDKASVQATSARAGDERMDAQGRLRACRAEASRALDEIARRGPDGILAVRGLAQHASTATGRVTARDAWEAITGYDDPDWAPTTIRSGGQATVIDSPGSTAATFTEHPDGTWSGKDGFGRPVGPGSLDDVTYGAVYNAENDERWDNDCNCDVDTRCNNPKCLTERDEEMARMSAEYAQMRRHTPTTEELLDYTHSVTYRDDPMGHEQARQILGDQYAGRH